ncbi:ABC transporter substrate-binding protein [Chitinimonas sp. BJYL2]|uniref:substrate-binding periplasmic protein n=1 Tax=Chitinimonas sp. BJYL2 TaxID=2976696 RepID=UPI0022B41206|nr:transporter substrate-binding domain-containing protein [Chitinimonas sp. BJYL2]
MTIRSLRMGGLVAILLLMPAWAETRPAGLTFCAEDQDAFPWLLDDGRGLNVIMLSMVSRQIGIPIRIERQPWKRCMAMLQAGQFDGAFKASFVEERMAFGHYPMLGNKPDPARRMMSETYHFYRKKGAQVSWDGTRLSRLNGPVGAQSGFSIVAYLRSLSLGVSDSTKSVEPILRMLEAGRLGVVALQTGAADAALRKNPDWQHKIERMEPPIQTKPYYLMLSDALVQQSPQLSKQLWDTIAAVRESPEYLREVARFE